MKKAINNMPERQPTEQGKIFANGMSNKELTHKIYKEFLKLNIKKFAKK